MEKTMSKKELAFWEAIRRLAKRGDESSQQMLDCEEKRRKEQGLLTLEEAMWATVEEIQAEQAKAETINNNLKRKTMSKATMTREELLKGTNDFPREAGSLSKRMDWWEQQHPGVKMSDLSDDEWVEVVSRLVPCPTSEAEELLWSLRARNA